MYQYEAIFKKVIQEIKQENRYRQFTQLVRDSARFPVMYDYDQKKDITIWCTNDYLGMSRNAKVMDAAMNAVKNHGVGSGGTRNISGTNHSIVKLESLLAKLHDKDNALVFSSGYVANDATLLSLSKIMSDIVYFSDELNHASIISGIRNSRAEKYVYKHVDINHLEFLIKQVDINRPKVIVFESVYSMDGTISPIKEICELAKKYNAITFIDEVHAVGLYGNNGAGIAHMQGLSGDIDIIQANMAKGYGVIGGYITGKNYIVDAIRSIASGFIFTTSLPPVITEAAYASIEHLIYSNEERNQHKVVVDKVKKRLEKAGIFFIKNDTHIIPVLVGDAEKAEKISEMLLKKYDIYIQHINFPTVPRGHERLRITPTPYHTDDMIDYLVESLIASLKYFNITTSVSRVA